MLPSPTIPGRAKHCSIILPRAEYRFEGFWVYQLAATRPRPGPGVAQPDRAVEDEPARRGVRVADKVALALELDWRVGIGAGETGLDHGVAQHLERMGVEIGHQIAVDAGNGAGE